MGLITVKTATHKKDFKIFIQFNDGIEGIIDLENYLEGEIFEPLKNLNYFGSFFIDSWTIGWENGADFAPEFLYDLLKKGK
jgi:hypothetical protein